VEGRHCVLIEGTTYTEENHEKPQSGKSVSQPRSEMGTSHFKLEVQTCLVVTETQYSKQFRTPNSHNEGTIFVIVSLLFYYYCKIFFPH
jgi:hypothetical protein